MSEPIDHDQLLELIHKLINRAISSEDFSRLSTELEENPAARLRYIECMSLHGDLKHRYMLEGDQTVSKHARELEQLLQECSGEASPAVFTTASFDPSLGLESSDGNSSFGFCRVGLPLLAALMLLAGGVGFLWSHSQRLQTDALTAAKPSPESLLVQRHNGKVEDAKRIALEKEIKAVAVLRREVNAKWSGLGPSYRVGESVSRGKIGLLSGVVQIDFYCGASMILEGPAEFGIQSPDKGFLYSGKIRVFVPDRARGFTVSSAQCEVLDLGTEFAMNVGPEQGSNIHVIDGEVRVSETQVGTPREKRLVTAGKSIRVADSGQVLEIKTKGHQFVGPSELDEMSLVSLDASFKKWQSSVDKYKRDPSLMAMYTFQESSEWDRVLVNSAANAAEEQGNAAIVGCRWTQGRWPFKRALYFNNASDRVRAYIPGLHDAVTLSAWINIEKMDHNMAIVRPDSNQTNFILWGLDVNAQRDSARLHFAVSDVLDGESTREHFSSGEHTGTGCFDGRDLNQWVHVAVSYDPLNRIVAHYKNGVSVAYNNISRAQKIGVGNCNLGNWPYKDWAKGTEFEIQNLNGAIDEFSAFSRVLPASEIRALYVAGLPEK